MIDRENIDTENGGGLKNPFHMRKNKVTEQEAWCAVSNALLQYAKDPSLANAHAVEAAARELSALRARFEALEKEIETRKARGREVPVRRYHPVGAAGCLPSHPEEGS